MTLSGNDILKYIPFAYLDRSQVAELMGKSTSQVEYYVKVGIKVSEGKNIKLPKETNGKFDTQAVIAFIDKTSKTK
jgi:phage terminase Nu1 subunit (DNA packaging protein)